MKFHEISYNIMKFGFDTGHLFFLYYTYTNRLYQALFNSRRLTCSKWSCRDPGRAPLNLTPFKPTPPGHGGLAPLERDVTSRFTSRAFQARPHQLVIAVEFRLRMHLLFWPDQIMRDLQCWEWQQFRISDFFFFSFSLTHGQKKHVTCHSGCFRVPFFS
jgi:hypothetical protein